jgi:phenylglyoxylate dehydrogenase epsilon subunit
MVKKHVIIGAGVAALSAARTIRRINALDDIKMITMEDCLPYSPAVLPYLISGRIDEDRIPIAGEDLLARMRVTLERGKQVVHVSTATNEVVYGNGGRDTYDTLLIASGSEPLRPGIEGIEEVGFTGCHTLMDCRAMKESLRDTRRVILYGAGLVSLEIGAALLEAGHKVHIVARSRILRRYFDPEAVAIISDIFHRHGAEIHEGKEIVKARRKDRSIRVDFSDSTSLEGDLLICCLGVAPRTGFLVDTPIKVSAGVVVDGAMRTNVPNVYGAGDVTESLDYFSREAGINAIAPTAISQGRIAGANMAGESVEDKGWIAMNVFKFLGHSAFSVGMEAHAEGSHILREVKEESFKELVFRDNRLVGARFIDIDVDPGVFRYLIEEAVPVAHKERLFEQPRETALWIMMENEKGMGTK